MSDIKSLKWNTSANFIGLGYTTIVGVVVLPLYLQYLGSEAFGLVGFFIVLQSWMQLLDMGMSPMLSRQAAQVRGRHTDFLELKKLLRSLELIIFLLAVTVAIAIVIGSSWIAGNWLNVITLDLADVSMCIALMGVMIALRFFASLYRSGIQGLERQVSLNIANVAVVTLKFIGALLILHYVTQEFVHFFIYQFFVGVIELVVLAVMFYKFIPSSEKVGVGIFWETLKPMLPFAGGIAYLTVIWVVITQLDKLILSKVLPLTEYGYFTLVVVVATGIAQVSGPINQAILPRMTYLLAKGKEQDMLALYRKSTQLMAVVILPLTGVIALFSTELLFAWSGDRNAAEWAGPVLFWFALGNGLLVISAFQYYLQFAHGKLKMHVIFNTVSACVQIPVIIYVAFEYGAFGVALTWFVFRLATFIFWTPIVHSKFAPGIHWPWVLKDIAPAFVLTSVLLLLVDSLYSGLYELDRLPIFVSLLGIGFVILVVNMLCLSESRRLFFDLMAKINLVSSEESR